MSGHLLAFVNNANLARLAGIFREGKTIKKPILADRFDRLLGGSGGI